MFAASESKGRAASLANLPKGAVLLIVLELCERFSFYGMLSLLALFLSDDTASGGFGWTSSRALSVVGIYSALAYSLPVLGGVLADRIWGARRGIAMGATVMTAGHFSMALPAFLQAELAEPALFGAIALLSLGNMLMKSPLTITLGDVFEGEDPRRQTAFAYYYVSISVGGLFAGILVGSVAESIGWHWGFSIAGVSMGFALLIYLSLAPRLLGQAGTKRGESQSSATIFSSIGKPAFYEPALLLVIMAGFICVFEIGWFQLYGSWTVFIRDSVAREIGNWTVPVPWFHAINSAVAIVVTPILAGYWARCEARGMRWSSLDKFVFALVMVTAAQAMMGLAAMVGDKLPGSIGWFLPALAIFTLTLGEIAAWVSSYNMVYRLAPEGHASAFMGAWYLMTLGVGGLIAGKAGAVLAPFGALPTFVGLTAICATGAVVLWVVIAPVQRFAARTGAQL